MISITIKYLRKTGVVFPMIFPCNSSAKLLEKSQSHGHLGDISICHWLRSQSWDPRLEPPNGFPAQPASPSAPPLSCADSFVLSLSQIHK